MNVDIPIACCAPIVSSRLTDDEAEATAEVFKALADPHRIRILNMLANSPGPICVCDFTGPTGLSQPTVSFHLKKLTAAGVLHREQRGTWAYYSINPKALAALAKAVAMKGADR